MDDNLYGDLDDNLYGDLDDDLYGDLDGDVSTFHTNYYKDDGWDHD